ncbi:MAG: DUF3078 domain-containing protein [Bacteroidales bacterium]|nr:DUF3078 domain-containing protein [Bacteroidales bacterium]
MTITISAIAFPKLGQAQQPYFTPEIDSICRNTLDYIRIKQSLTLQEYEIDRDAEQLQNTIEVLSRHLDNARLEKQAVNAELAAINRHIDSLIPKRPNGPRPKENIIDILYERMSFHGSYGLNINQLALSNWAAGGENSATGKAFANFSLIYRNKSFEQKLNGAFAFGISRFADKRIEKQDDKIDLTYALLLNSKTQWNISMVATFNTQFANGYKYPNDSTVISTFFAPAYLTLSAGYTYKTRDERFQIFLSPLAGKVTFVMNQDLADLGSFGVVKGHYDQDSLWIPGENIAAAVGVNAIVNYKQPIGKNITYITMLNAFYNYTEHRDDDRLRLDFNWENTMNFIISKHLTTILFVNLKYDHNTTFPVYETIEGVETVVDNVPKLQFKESLGIAFVHNF